jgi:hypothetical protein
LELHAELFAVGAVIDPGEQTGRTFGPTTAAAVRAFRQQYGLPAGETVDLSTGRVMQVASAFAGPDGRGAARKAVREAAAAADTSQSQELYWLARYATAAGDYDMASSIARRIPDHRDVQGVIDPILDLPDRQPWPPELPYPENFYTYRRDLYPSEALNDIQREVIAVGQPQRDPSQAHGPDLGPDAGRGSTLIQAAASWLEAIKQWQTGNRALNHRHHADAQLAYDACQSAACDYFAKFYALDLGVGSVTDRLTALVKHLADNREAWSVLWSRVVWRRALLSLEELQVWDWTTAAVNLFVPRAHDPSPIVGTLPPGPDYGLGFIQHYLHREEIGDPRRADRQNVLEAPLLTIAMVLVPLARAELNRARRQYDAAARDLRLIMDSVVIGKIFPTPQDPGPVRPVLARLACEFIEVPFARLLLAETMLDKADAEYKARTPAAEPQSPDVSQFQSLKAAQTYLAIKDVFREEAAYTANVESAATELTQSVGQHVASNDTQGRDFQLLGKNILIPVLASSSTTLPGLDRGRKAHEPLLKFKEGQTVLRETNPRVYAALLTATARLEQLKAGFNYLGYSDNYVPPWRFQYLLERARYFAEHAKNAQREYLNFLSNAEREEFQELSTAQNVEMEKSNVRIETARVDQSQRELSASAASNELAVLTAGNARIRFEKYEAMDRRIDSLEERSGWSSLLSGLGNFAVTLGTAAASGGVSAAIGLGAAAVVIGQGEAGKAQTKIAAEQREFEKENLRLASDEAQQASTIARLQLAAAQSGLIVAGLQRQAALLRHEFAIQNLQFLRNRVLSAEQWYRLAAAIRSVSETYLRYSIELAFLAEQAYEFEADKPINVIRFDYDLSEVGDFLAADFLLRDLDRLEQDLIVTQRQRQQQVRYVLSMARDFPEALQEIRDSGRTTFSLRLEGIEKRFPGLYNLRVGAVDVLPVALMDSTRFSLELTHLGTSHVRLKAHADTASGIPSPSPLNQNNLPVPADGWLSGLQETWPVKIRVIGPETLVFSGLIRQDANAVFAFATTSQRNAFEGLGAAGAWQVDFTARENQVVPGTLADLLMTFTLSGYHDPELRHAIDIAPRPTTAVTRWLSARTTFPDAHYEFNRSGRLTWNVTRELLTLSDTLGAVRNVAVLLLPTAGRTNYFGMLMSRWDVQIRITSAGALIVISEIPKVTFGAGDAANPLLLAAKATLPPGAEISWDFGDGSVRQSGAEQQYTYTKPGRYTVALRVVRNGRLSEFRADVVMSRSHAEGLRLPVTAFPNLTREAGSKVPAGHTRVVGKLTAPADDPAVATWRIGEQGGVKGNRASFDLKPGEYTLSFSAVRLLKARVYCTQRHVSEPLFHFNGLSLTSNRRFDLNGIEISGTSENPPANLLAKHLFKEGALSPVDEWTVELPLSDNPFLRSVSGTDVEQYGFCEIEDVVLTLEYESTPGPISR